MKEDDIDLISDCVSGKREAQYKLYNKYSGAMYSICRRMIKVEVEAEDVLQNSFIDVFTKLKMFKHESTPGAWIKRIVINNCINHLRKNNLDIKELDNNLEVAEVNNEDFVEYNVGIIMNAIEQLPEGYRVVFCLYAIEGYDHGEISEILNISESTSKSQYSRARSKIYNLMKDSGELNKIFIS